MHTRLYCEARCLNMLKLDASLYLSRLPNDQILNHWLNIENNWTDIWFGIGRHKKGKQTWPPQIRLLTMLWSFEKGTILTP